MSRFAVIISSFIAAAAAFLSGVTPAFATRVTPISDSSDQAASVAHSSGLAAWQMSLVALAAFVIVTTVALLAVKLVTRRSAIEPALH